MHRQITLSNKTYTYTTEQKKKCHYENLVDLSINNNNNAREEKELFLRRKLLFLYEIGGKR